MDAEKLRAGLEQQLHQALLERYDPAREAELAGQLGLSRPSNLRQYISGRTPLLSATGLRLLSALGLREVRPVWGAGVRFEYVPLSTPRERGPALRSAEQAIARAPATIEGRLVRAFNGRLSALSVPRRALAVAVLGKPQVSQISWLNTGRAQLIGKGKRGLQLLWALGATDFELVWDRAPAFSEAKRRKKDPAE